MTASRASSSGRITSSRSPVSRAARTRKWLPFRARRQASVATSRTFSTRWRASFSAQTSSAWQRPLDRPPRQVPGPLEPRAQPHRLGEGVDDTEPSRRRASRSASGSCSCPGRGPHRDRSQAPPAHGRGASAPMRHYPAQTRLSHAPCETSSDRAEKSATWHEDYMTARAEASCACPAGCPAGVLAVARRHAQDPG